MNSYFLTFLITVGPDSWSDRCIIQVVYKYSRLSLITLETHIQVNSLPTLWFVKPASFHPLRQ